VLVHISGSGFTPGTTVTASIGSGATITSCGATVNSTGGFTCSVTITSTTPASYTVNATGADGAFDSATASFGITVPTISVTPISESSGSPYTVGGSGFSVSSPVTVSFNGVAQTPTSCGIGTFSGTTITTDSQGRFACNFDVPNVGAGSYNIMGSDVATGASAPSPNVFTVTSSSSSPSYGFLLWLLIAVIVVIAIVGFILYRRNRSAPAPSSVQAWQGTAPPAGAGEVGPAAAVAMAPARPDYLETSEDAEPSSAGPPAPAGEGEPDIDSLMAELDKISGEILKRVPKKDDTSGSGDSGSEPPN
jgi:hypothetical protein